MFYVRVYALVYTILCVPTEILTFLSRSFALDSIHTPSASPIIACALFSFWGYSVRQTCVHERFRFFFSNRKCLRFGIENHPTVVLGFFEKHFKRFSIDVRSILLNLLHPMAYDCDTIIITNKKCSVRAIYLRFIQFKYKLYSKGTIIISCVHRLMSEELDLCDMRPRRCKTKFWHFII